MFPHLNNKDAEVYFESVHRPGAVNTHCNAPNVYNPWLKIVPNKMHFLFK